MHLTEVFQTLRNALIEGVYSTLAERDEATWKARDHQEQRCQGRSAPAKRVPELRLIALMCLVLSLGGCSAVKVAYNNSDFLLLRYADSYLDLTSAQNAYLRTHLRKRLEEHRQEELSSYVSLLNSVKDTARENVTPQELEVIFVSAWRLIQASIIKTIPVFTPVLAQLSEQQIDYLEKQMNKKNQQYVKEYIQRSQDDRLEARTRRTMERVEKWIGSLSDEQKSLISNISNEWPDVASEWFQYRQLKQQELLVLLRTKNSKYQIESFLIHWWVDQSDQNPRLTAKIGELRQGFRTLIIAIDKSLSSAQRNYFIKRIDRLSKNLKSLLPESTSPDYASISRYASQLN